MKTLRYLSLVLFLLPVNLFAADATPTVARDRAGNVISETDQSDRTTLHTYDMQNRIRKTIDSDSKATYYSYDDKNGTTIITHPDGSVVQIPTPAKNDAQK